MSPQAEEIWAILREAAQIRKDTDRRIAQLGQETDRKIQDLVNSNKETDHKIQELVNSNKETDHKIQDLADRIKETDRIVNKLSKNLGDLGNRLGEFVEYMVAPAAVRLFQLRGIPVHEFHQDVTAKRNGEGIEIDLLVVNDDTLVAVECKSKLTCEHVDAHIVRMERLKRLLPAYRNYRAVGAVAAMVMNESVRDYAIAQGFYVLCQNGEQVDISNTIEFAPRVW
ncbi:DUF3782 domain-containing protein [Rhodopseudomonas palustris]|uniref:DUF3782 domain-containing protein n=1 Tax=Thiospirillum jenense TaxID=1653858 RepID=A0A839HCA6_9GAMM|nr:DUF3782 domain-containing protein [Thiospirillum jenense]MBB1091981.1 DUF3782 domain-containing protein [Rhodopseudomonas palustris]MBB1126301.1 DUF3782 domain-containing protein [Thiospirillum jenense]